MQKHGDYIEVNNEKININIKRYSNSKSLRLIVNSNGCTVTSPKRYSQTLIYKFIDKNTDFIYGAYTKLKKLEDKKETRKWITGEYILYKGVELKVEINSMDKPKVGIQILDDTIKIDIKDNIEEVHRIKKIRDAVIKIYKEKCKEYLEDRLEYWRNITKIEYNSFKVKDVKSKWGSCSSKGNLNFSYKIIMMPEYISDHIIVHELCHIKNMNHSKDFWNLVYSYLPEYKQQKKWLRENIRSLEV